MAELFEAVRKKFTAFARLVRASWSKMSKTGRVIVSGWAVTCGICLLFGGIAGQAAIFGLTSLVTLGIIVSYFPKGVAWSIRNMAVADLIATSFIVYFGVLSGVATITLGMFLLGFGVSAGLRLFEPFEPELAKMKSKVNFKLPEGWKFWKSTDGETKEVGCLPASAN